MTPLAITFLINILTSFIKNYALPKWGKPGVHFIVFVFACAGAAYYLHLRNIAGVEMFVGTVVTLFAMSVAFYEVILSYFPFFRSGDTRIEEQAKATVDNVVEK